ncbi:MAG TPA: hypothetical protein VMV23_00315 [Candidatus Nanopelagicaceae bacterium]|nr:hypothetical protein [Candidatus Nanopelagicaceae bacterium]
MGQPASDRIPRALERIADALEGQLDFLLEQKAEGLRLMEEAKARIKADPPRPGPDYNLMQAKAVLALLRQVGVPEEQIPAIPEDPAEMPNWVVDMGLAIAHHQEEEGEEGPAV